jgi:hypothetical protein
LAGIVRHQQQRWAANITIIVRVDGWDFDPWPIGAKWRGRLSGATIRPRENALAAADGVSAAKFAIGEGKRSKKCHHLWTIR